MEEMLQLRTHNLRVQYSLNIVLEIQKDNFKVTVYTDNEAYAWNIMIQYFDVGTLIEKCTNRCTKTIEFIYQKK